MAATTKRSLQVGDLVTCKEPVDAYGSRYAGQPFCQFTPDDVGIVTGTGIVSVWRENVTFTTVDFFKEGVYPGWGKSNDTPWRAALLRDNIVPLEPQEV